MIGSILNTSNSGNRPQAITGRYRPEIDGLRAFAVVAVIINHFSKDLLPSGYLGVDIFFVISGYVITSSLTGKKSKSLVTFLAEFYARRIKRLVPALVVFVLLTCVLISLFNPDPRGAHSLGWRSLFGISNIELYRTSTDYFADSRELNPFTHTWSLGVEEQFYVLFPFVIWFSGFGPQTKNGARNLFFCVAALTTGSLISFIYLYQVSQPAAYFLMPARFWELAAGCLIFIGFKKQAMIEQVFEKVPPLLILAVLVWVLFLPVSAAVPATISAVVLSAILIACLKKETAAYKLFTLKQVVFVGLISYSLYLWHWTVLSIARWTIGIHWWSIPPIVGLMVLISLSSYELIETPFRQAKWSLTPAKTFGAGLVATTSSAALIILCQRAMPLNLFMGSKAITQTEIQAAYPPSKQCNIYENHPQTVRLSVDCGVTRFKNRPTLYSLGDSHAQQFNDVLAAYAERKEYNYIFIWGNSCLFPAAVLRKGDKDCYNRQEIVGNLVLKNIRSGDIVLVGNALYLRFNNNWVDDEKYHAQNGASLSIKNAAKRFSQMFQSFSDKVTAKGGKVILYIDGAQFPSLRGSGNMCKTEWYRPQWAMATECFHSLDNHLKIIDDNFSWRNSWDNRKTKIVWNAYRYGDSCPGRICNASRYRDGNHFTKEYAALNFYLFIRDHPNLFASKHKRMAFW